MEFKGTKGKWEVRGNKIFILNKYHDIATIHIQKELLKIGIEDIEQKANALLISKAPEMLEMIKKLMAYMPKNNIDDANMYYEALELIKQATEI